MRASVSKIVNISRFRKQKAREEKRQAGGAAALRHGVGKAQKALDDARARKAKRDLDGHERE